MPAHRRLAPLTALLLAAALTPALSSCSELVRIVELLQAATRPAVPQVAIVSPTSDSTESIGIMGEIEWADIAPEEGTTVTVDIIRFDASDAVIDSTTLLAGRDAQADGDADLFLIDSTNFVAGRYRFRVTLTAPSGLTAVVLSTAVVTFQ